MYLCMGVPTLSLTKCCKEELVRCCGLDSQCGSCGVCNGGDLGPSTSGGFGHRIGRCCSRMGGEICEVGLLEGRNGLLEDIEMSGFC